MGEQMGRNDSPALVRKRGQLLEAQQMLDMKIAGFTRTQVAERYNYSEKTVDRRWSLAIKHRAHETAETYLALENERLNAQYLILQAIIMDPRTPPRDRVAAATAMTKTTETRAKINGFDRLIVEHTGTVSVRDGGVDAEVERLAQELGMSEAAADAPSVAV